MPPRIAKCALCAASLRQPPHLAAITHRCSQCSSILCRPCFDDADRHAACVMKRRAELREALAQRLETETSRGRFVAPSV